jgi:hypothetical protein
LFKEHLDIYLECLTSVQTRSKFQRRHRVLKESSIILAFDRESRTLQVNVANVGLEGGEEEMLYWQMRIAGNIDRKLESGRVAEGCASRISRGDRHLSVTFSSNSSPVRSNSCARSLSSGMLLATLWMFYLVKIMCYSGDQNSSLFPFVSLVDLAPRTHQDNPSQKWDV